MWFRAAGSVTAVVLALVIMLSFDSARCRGWTLPDQAHTSLWLLIFIIFGPAAGVAVYQARNWEQLAHRMMHGEADQANRFPPTPYEKLLKQDREHLRLTLPHNRILAIVCVGWVLFCTIPLFLIAKSCAAWP